MSWENKSHLLKTSYVIRLLVLNSELPLSLFASHLARGGTQFLIIAVCFRHRPGRLKSSQVNGKVRASRQKGIVNFKKKLKELKLYNYNI